MAEKRLIALSEELRCLVCQNQNIADSHAELAQDLRREIRGMIQAGKSDKKSSISWSPAMAISSLPAAGQGHHPRALGRTLLLMLVGLVALVRYLGQRNRRVTDDAPLTADEARRAEALLNETRNP